MKNGDDTDKERDLELRCKNVGLYVQLCQKKLKELEKELKKLEKEVNR